MQPILQAPFAIVQYRNIQHMRKSLVLVRNLLGQDGVPVTVKECLDVVNDIMTEKLHAPDEGEIN